LGHLSVADAAARAAGLDMLMFMPAHVQPFKAGAAAAPGVHREMMLRLALEGRPGFSVTDVELRAKGVSYTLNSLRAVRAGLPEGADVFFVLGADVFTMLDKWYRSDELLREFSFIAAARPGEDMAAFAGFAAMLRARWGTEVVLMDNPPVDISSSEVRERVRRGESVAGMVPAAVEEYIYENGLYGRGL
jgi:nicotinate-nucleotide adenylyltransferase